MKKEEKEFPIFRPSVAKKEALVKWFSELGKKSIGVAGGKGANLAEIYNLKIPVPPGFVITAQAYSYFIDANGLREKMHGLLKGIDYEDTKKLDEAAGKIRDLIVKGLIPRDMEEEIIESYESLSANPEDGKADADDLITGKGEISVAVRSSATSEDLEDASFAGQQETFVDVKGKGNLLESVKKCFASLFTSRATYYRNKKGFRHEDSKLAVVVQKMVNSDKSGVVFSKDPTGAGEDIVIEAVFGLGEGIVSGEITPDKYLVSRGIEIINKNVSDKKIAVGFEAGKKRIIKLSKEVSSSQVLREHEIGELAEIALKLEKHYSKPQDIEFAIENGKIYIVQTRAITTLGKKPKDFGGKEIKGEIVLRGIAASPGMGVGKVKIVKRAEDLGGVKKGDVLVTKMTNPDMVVTMQRASAIVTDEGGMTSHAAIVSREMGIPSVVGTREATQKLKEDEIVTVDGYNGAIYKGKVSEIVRQEIVPLKQRTKTKIKVIIDLPSFAERAARTGIKEVGLLRIEGIIAESGKHPSHFIENGKIREYEEIVFKGVGKIADHFDGLWVRTSDIRSDEFGNLLGSPKSRETNPMLGMHGIRYGLKNPEILKAEMSALKKISDRGKRMGILLPQVISVEEVRKAKEIAREIGFGKARIGVMIETPASVQIIKDLCAEGIGFISFGTNDLTQYTLAVDRGNEQVQGIYDEMDPSVLSQLEYVIRACKKNSVETSICGQAGSRKEMVKFLVEKGIDSISVNADSAKEISDLIFSLEGGREEKEFPIKIPEEELVPPEELQEDEETKGEDRQNIPQAKNKKI
jgi:pyruvate,water dikinase